MKISRDRDEVATRRVSHFIVNGKKFTKAKCSTHIRRGSPEVFETPHDIATSRYDDRKNIEARRRRLATTHLRRMRATFRRVARFATQSAIRYASLELPAGAAQYAGHLSVLYQYTALAALAKSRVLCHRRAGRSELLPVRNLCPRTIGQDRARGLWLRAEGAVADLATSLPDGRLAVTDSFGNVERFLHEFQTYTLFRQSVTISTHRSE